MSEYVIPRDEEKKILDTLAKRQDADAARMRRYLAMPDLSRTPQSPIKELVDKITSVPDFKSFDTVDVPEIVPMDIAFDLFDFAHDHPARSPSDTYFADDTHLLRPHTTVMWYYYLTSGPIKRDWPLTKTSGCFLSARSTAKMR